MHDDLTLNWTPGFSLTSQQVVWLPACLVYVPYKFSAGEDPLIWETISTGAACGTSLEAAILNGIFEIVERDALMMTWLQQRSVPRLALSTLPPKLHGLVRQYHQTAFQVSLSDVTTEFQIPTFLTILTATRAQKPFSVVAGAAHFDPAIAIGKSLCEPIQVLEAYLKRAARYRGKHWRQDRFAWIQSLEEHFLLYAHLDLRRAFDFLTQAAATVDFGDLPDLTSGSLVQDIEKCIALFQTHEMDILVKDITPQEIKEQGFYVVKVIIPGTQPMNASYAHRFLGNRRLSPSAYNMATSGSSSGTPEAINPLPHPFP